MSEYNEMLFTGERDESNLPAIEIWRNSSLTARKRSCGCSWCWQRCRISCKSIKKSFENCRLIVQRIIGKEGGHLVKSFV